MSKHSNASHEIHRTTLTGGDADLMQQVLGQLGHEFFAAGAAFTL